MKFTILCACVLFMAGCATMERYDVNLYGIDYQDDAEILMGELVEAVTPASMPDTGHRALILPFALRQDMAVRKDVGREMADIFRRAWLERRVFGAMEYDASQPWPGLNQAMSLARAKGANILVTGNVSQFYEGGGAGRTSVGVTAEVYWVPDGTLIWSAAQAAAMEAGPAKDYVLVRSQVRLPENPTYAVMRALSLSMADGFARHLGR
jgi:hypothetical protein